MHIVQTLTTPLSSGFMGISIIGLMVSVWITANITETWGFTFIMLFIAMFIAGMMSMTNVDTQDSSIDLLYINDSQKPEFLKKNKQD